MAIITKIIHIPTADIPKIKNAPSFFFQLLSLSINFPMITKHILTTKAENIQIITVSNMELCK